MRTCLLRDCENWWIVCRVNTVLRVRPYFTLALVPVIFCHPSALTPTANISIHMITIQHHVRMVCLVRTVDCGPNYIMVGEASDAMSKGLPSLLLTLDIGNYKYLMWELPSSSTLPRPIHCYPAQPSHFGELQNRWWKQPQAWRPLPLFPARLSQRERVSQSWNSFVAGKVQRNKLFAFNQSRTSMQMEN